MNMLLYYQNVRGLRTKLNEVLLQTAELNYDIYCFTETWLNDTFSSSELFTSSYNVFRCDRREASGSRGGGTLIALKKGFTAHRREDLENFEDCVWLEVSGTSHESLLIGVYYFSQHISVDIFEQCINWLENNLKSNESSVVLLGDFNLPKVDWDTYDVSDCTYYNSLKAVTLIDTVNVLGLSQINSFKNSINVILDLAFVNFPVSSSPVIDTVVPIDVYHPVLIFNLCFNVKRPTASTRTVFNYGKGNYYHLYNSFRSIDWQSTLGTSNVNEAVSTFTDLVYGKLKEFIPIKIVKSKKFPSWYTSELIKKIKHKNFLHKKWKKHRNPESYLNFSNSRRDCKLILKRDRSAFYDRVENNLILYPKDFWKYTDKHFNNTSTNIILKEQNRLVLDPSAVAQIFANHFDNVCNASSKTFHHPTFTVGSSLPPFVISVQEVIAAIKKLKSSKTSGNDSIPSFIVKGCAEILAPALTHIFNLSLINSVFPEIWKVSVIVPVFKKGSRLCAENYRPISLLCTFSKIFELVVFEHLYGAVSPYLSDSQHGFVRKKSTATNLVSFMEHVAPVVENKGQVDTVYFDMSKAFDSVNHDLLLLKLECFGIAPSLIKWFSSYLHLRSNIIKTSSMISSSIFISASGVPQGSVLGPLLFVIFVNDIFSNINTHALMYADDLKVFCEIKQNTDCLHLQQDISDIASWCSSNCLLLNLSKTNIVTFSRKTNVLHCNYKLYGKVIDRVLYIRDLGVIFQYDLRFNKHVSNLCATMAKVLGIIIRITRPFKSHASVMCLYKSLILSRHNYVSIVWNNLTEKCISRVESVQKKFIFHLCKTYCKDIGYYHHETLLKYFKLSPLKTVRAIADLNFLYKSLNNYYCCSGLVHNYNFNIGTSFLRSPCYFYVKKSSNLVPSTRIQLLFNQYCSDLDLFCNNSSGFNDCLIRILS